MSNIDSSMKRWAEAQTSIGQILTADARRDALHFAVAPVRALRTLAPGQHIGPGDTEPGFKERIGIADPFLRCAVAPGERFWLFLYPNTITALRHVWDHPAFSAEDAPVSPDKAVSEAWLRNFCDSADCPGYDAVMHAIQGFFETDEYDLGGYINGEYLHFRGRDAHGEIPPEFWTHAEIVLGRALPYHPEAFSCSC